jgi:hypothetical protein
MRIFFFFPFQQAGAAKARPRRRLRARPRIATAASEINYPVSPPFEFLMPSVPDAGHRGAHAARQSTQGIRGATGGGRPPNAPPRIPRGDAA